MVDQLADGMVLKPAVKYQRVAQTVMARRPSATRRGHDDRRGRYRSLTLAPIVGFAEFLFNASNAAPIRQPTQMRLCDRTTCNNFKIGHLGNRDAPGLP